MVSTTSLDNGWSAQCFDAQKVPIEALKLEARGIPFRHLWALAESHGFLEQLEKLRVQSTGDLQALCRGRGLPFAVLQHHQELSCCLFALLIWEQLPATEIKRECKKFVHACINPEQEDESPVQQLIGALWLAILEARGIPVQRLGRQVAENVLTEFLKLEAMGKAALEAEYIWALKKLGVPPETDVDDHYMRECITSIHIWEKLPIADLLSECKGPQVLAHPSDHAAKSGTCNDAQTGNDSRHQLVQSLFIRVCCKEKWESKGIPVGALTVVAANRVAHRHELLEDMSETELVVEYEALGFRQEVGMQVQREDMQNRLRADAVWQEMTLLELANACRNVGVQVSPRVEDPALDAESLVEHREKLITQLKTGMCLTPWEAARWEERGIPVQRLGTVSAATKVINHVTRLEAMPLPDLQCEYAEVGLPLEAGCPPTDIQSLLARLTAVACWRGLPLKELQRECCEVGAMSAGFDSQRADEEQKQELIERLVVAKWADKWRDTDVPTKRLGTIKAIMGVIRVFAEFNSMDNDALTKAYAALTSLPPCAFSPPADRVDLLARMKRIAIWKELPMAELREECMQSAVSFRVDGNRSASDSELRKELVERLVMATCANKWEERGVPITKLPNIHAAVTLQSRWDELDTFGVKDLRKEYAKLGLPPEAAAPKVLDLLPRLRLTALWQALPAAELQQECRKLGVLLNPRELKHSDLCQRLVFTSWGPPRSSSPQGDPRKTVPEDSGPPPSEVLQEIAGHFSTLQLPPTASTQDLKRAYRKLVLVHHPDKNPDASQEASTAMFRKVVEAYEAVDKFMSMGKR